jgi:hypothetical protein
MTPGHLFIESLEPRELLNGQIEVLQGSGTFTTSDVTDLSVGNGVHVRANTSGTILGNSPEKNTYLWDFGDLGSEFNTTPGFSSAHVYDAAGTYTVSLTVTDGETGAVRTDSVDVTISADTRTKYYVSSAGNDNNTGTSTSAPFKTLRKAFTKITSANVEILLNRGDTFNVADDGNYLPLQVNQNNVYIGAYGSNSNKPVVNWMHQGSGATIFKIGTPKHNLTLDGISVTSVAASNPLGGKPDFFSCDSNSTSTNVVVRDVSFDHLDTFFHSTGTGLTGVLIQDSSSAATTDPNFVSVKHNDVYATGSDYTYLGNTFGDSFGEHNIRSFVDFSLAYKNDLTNPRTGTTDDGTGQNKSLNTLRQQSGDYIYWANNTTHAGSMTMGPGTTEGADPVNYLVMENNVCYQLPADPTVLKDDNNEKVKSEGGIHHVMIRNNVFQASNKPTLDIVPVSSDHVFVYNNTAYNTDIHYTQQPQLDGTTGQFLKFDGGTSNATGAFFIVNNLYYAPSLINSGGSGGMFLNGSGTSMLASVTNNVWTDPGGTTSSIASAAVRDGTRTYYTKTDWNNTTNVGTDTFANVTFNTTSFTPGTSAIVGTSVNGVSTDLNGKARPTSGAWTDGAVEIQTTGGTGSISGYYFGDSDGDGTLNGTEVKQSGKTMYLDLNTNGVKDTGEPTSTTDTNGNYSFTGLDAGEYFVRRDGLPSGFRLSTPAPGFYDVILGDGESATDKNFGSTSNALISGVVFEDANNNGARDGGEVGVSGVTVYADINTNGTFDAGDKSTVTDASGNWSVHELGAGTYQLRVIPGTGFQQTLPASNGAINVTVSGGQIVSNELFGIRASATGSISGHYFGDSDGDGIWDTNESAQPGKVMYIDANNNGVKDTGETTSTTDTNGLYSFSGLGEGTYVIRRDGLPSGFRFSTPDAQYYQIQLQAGQSSTDNDFGTTQRIRISGFYFGDSDDDGVWDANEDGQSGKTMYLDADNDGVRDTGELTSVTDQTGYYSFIGLDAINVTTYHVRRDGLPSGYHLTIPSTGVYDIAVAPGFTYDNKNFGSAVN